MKDFKPLEPGDEIAEVLLPDGTSLKNVTLVHTPNSLRSLDQSSVDRYWVVKDYHKRHRVITGDIHFIV